MAIFYADQRVYSKSTTAPSAVVAYLRRTVGVDAPGEQVDYLTRTRATDVARGDLQHEETAHMPRWAKDATSFFQASYTYEQRNGVWAIGLQLALPRELSRAQQVALTREFVGSVLSDKPTLWVLHDHLSKRDGLPQPHVHVLFSARPNDGRELPPDIFFQQHHPRRSAQTGAKKDLFFTKRYATERIRVAWADLTNHHLRQAGLDIAVDPRSLHARGIERPSRAKVWPVPSPEMAPALTPDQRTHEQTIARAWRDSRELLYDRSLPMAPQITAHMRDYTPGKYPPIPAVEDITRLQQQLRDAAEYLTHQQGERNKLRNRGKGLTTPLLPTETSRLLRLRQRAVSQDIPLPSVDGERIAAGAQLDKSHGKDAGHGYES